jgi:sigma-B regulation protein RsbU (phosphoserine phosphatase)
MSDSAESPVQGVQRAPAKTPLFQIGRLEVGNLEVLFLLSLVGSAATRFYPFPVIVELILLGLAAGLGVAVTARLMKTAIRQLIWRLRNRLIVAYIFIGVIPVMATFALAAGAAYYLLGQVGAYLVHAELERRLNALDGAAHSLARAPVERREALRERIDGFYRERFPGLEILIADKDRMPPAAPPPTWGEIKGIVVKDGYLYAWARALNGDAQVTLTAPLTRRWLADLTPDLGGVSVIHFPDPSTNRIRSITMKPHPPAPGEDDDPPVVPPAANRFDVDLRAAVAIPVALWESPQSLERSLLAMHSRVSALMRILLLDKQTAGAAESWLVLLAVGFLIAQILSVRTGVSITRRITEAVNALYEGTERVMRGDFSHRIAVRGNEQIAELSSSFNRMTENLEHLLVVAEEKERMQAELEIAREVQKQLFPRSSPGLESLDLRALCNPARMVSGDYYDYQGIGGGCIAIAIGDVAGKGISAALLMATLQSSLRTQLRTAQESAGCGDGVEHNLSPSVLVSRLNVQLYADTAPEKYATFCFAVYNDSTGILTYTNAGHLPPLLVRRGEVSQFEINGMVVGAFPFAKYNESSTKLEQGDLVVFYTDGIVEPENEFGEMFGEDQLKQVLLRSADLNTDQILSAVIDAVGKHTGSPELQDDMTILVMRKS